MHKRQEFWFGVTQNIRNPWNKMKKRKQKTVQSNTTRAAHALATEKQSRVRCVRACAYLDPVLGDHAHVQGICVLVFLDGGRHLAQLQLQE